MPAWLDKIKDEAWRVPEPAGFWVLVVDGRRFNSVSVA